MYIDVETEFFPKTRFLITIANFFPIAINLRKNEKRKLDVYLPNFKLWYFCYYCGSPATIQTFSRKEVTYFKQQQIAWQMSLTSFQSKFFLFLPTPGSSKGGEEKV